MKRLASILLVIFMLAVLASCSSAKPKNAITPVKLTAEQQDLLSLINNLELKTVVMQAIQEHR